MDQTQARAQAPGVGWDWSHWGALKERYGTTRTRFAFSRLHRGALRATGCLGSSPDAPNPARSSMCATHYVAPPRGRQLLLRAIVARRGRKRWCREGERKPPPWPGRSREHHLAIAAEPPSSPGSSPSVVEGAGEGAWAGSSAAAATGAHLELYRGSRWRCLQSLAASTRRRPRVAPGRKRTRGRGA
jgi:hypothetical protein